MNGVLAIHHVNTGTLPDDKQSMCIPLHINVGVTPVDVPCPDI